MDRNVMDRNYDVKIFISKYLYLSKAEATIFANIVKIPIFLIKKNFKRIFKMF